MEETNNQVGVVIINNQYKVVPVAGTKNNGEDVELSGLTISSKGVQKFVNDEMAKQFIATCRVEEAESALEQERMAHQKTKLKLRAALELIATLGE